MGGKQNGDLSSIRRKEASKWDRSDDKQSTSSQQHIAKSTQVIVETSSIEGAKPQVPRKDNKDYPWEEQV